mmetsp:Transcript_40143/g.62802  ORF Transcript_40143/g.62802 Transcript_40143/m.62802 type:complete len:137 (+) Transcript_40143:120-530(+)|eukprot:CAMPEP_0194558942 /NCGR_PEP_ID=MMETSP0292-20121207/668_1 /TAXON_ID=39354 /ORGANISM="Heterosigma akashiwo, Strain CCMP2393" /LENGTH=136 /DNA_ID=CAMNT_0039406717 /DNA_START=117 /DNA_END=527 /DNA_ORIENTATION=+
MSVFRVPANYAKRSGMLSLWTSHFSRDVLACSAHPFLLVRSFAAAPLHPSEKLKAILKTYANEQFPHEFPARIRDQIVNSSDLNNDGYIDRSELRKLLKNVGADISLSDISQIIDLGDIDGSGKIRKDKFLEMLKD